MSNAENNDALHITGAIVSAFAGNNPMRADELPPLIQDIYTSVSGLANGVLARRDPAVPINKSITNDHVICLEDGKKLKMLKRYLRTHYDLSPEEYRRRWGLPDDYPMVAPSYGKERSKLAKKFGLGRRVEDRRPPRKKTTRKTSRKGR